MNEYNKKNNFGGNGNGTNKKPYKKNYNNRGNRGNGTSGIKNKKLSFNDLCVSRELQAVDKAWDSFVCDYYKSIMIDADEKTMNEALDNIERARPFYILTREKIKARFSLNQERAKEKEEEMKNRGRALGLDPGAGYGVVNDYIYDGMPYIDTGAVIDIADKIHGKSKDDGSKEFHFNSEHDDLRGKSYEGIIELIGEVSKEEN